MKNEQPYRIPVFIRILFILSLSYTGVGILSMLMSFIRGSLSGVEVEKSISDMYDLLTANGAATVNDVIYKMIEMPKYTNANFAVDKLINIIGYAVGFLSIGMMMKRNQKGLHYYIIYNLVITLSVYASAPPSAVPWQYVAFNFLFATFFVFLYYRNIPWIREE